MNPVGNFPRLSRQVRVWYLRRNKVAIWVPLTRAVVRVWVYEESHTAMADYLGG